MKLSSIPFIGQKRLTRADNNDFQGESRHLSSLDLNTPDTSPSQYEFHFRLSHRIKIHEGRPRGKIELVPIGPGTTEASPAKRRTAITPNPHMLVQRNPNRIGFSFSFFQWVAYTAVEAIVTVLKSSRSWRFGEDWSC